MKKHLSALAIVALTLCTCGAPARAAWPAPEPALGLGLRQSIPQPPGMAPATPLQPLATSLDASFNGTGVVVGDRDGNDEAVAVAIQPDGKIVAAVASPDAFDSVLVRYNADGSLDGSADLGDVRATDIALQDDGNIVVAGYADNSATGQGHDFFVGRVNRDTLTLTLQTTTDLFAGSEDHANAVALQPDDKIVVAGYADLDDHDQFAWLRFGSDGTLDTSVGTDGRVMTDFESMGGTDARILDLAIQSDGKITAVGYANNGTTDNPGVARYNGDGTLDTSFGDDNSGVWYTSTLSTLYDGRITGATLESDDKIVAVGYVDYLGNYDFFVVRLNANGSIDQSFAATNYDFGGDDKATDVAVQADGKIVVVGSTTPAGGGESNLALVRFHSDGEVDTAFGFGGQVTTDLGDDDTINGVVPQPDGKIVVAGSTVPVAGAPSDFVLARYKDVVQVTLSKTASPTAMRPGRSLGYTLSFAVGSTGGSAVITDIVPSYLTGYTYTVGAGVVATPTGSVDYVWDVLVPAQGGTIEISGIVSPGLTADTTFANHAFIRGPENSAQASVSVVVDTTPPDTSISEHPPNPDGDPTPTFGFTGSDGRGSGIASFQCQMDGGGWSTCTSPHTPPPLDLGSHTFEVYAIDHVGYVDATPASYTWSIVEIPSLALNKTVDTGGLAEVPAGGTVTYTLFLTNSGLGSATSTVMTDVLPSAVSFGNWVQQGSASLLLPPPGGTIAWGPWDVPGDRNYTISFTAVVSDSDDFAGQTVTNTVSLSAANHDPLQDSASFTVEEETEVEIYYYIYLPVVVRNG